MQLLRINIDGATLRGFELPLRRSENAAAVVDIDVSSVF
jgi:hypothetical protein